MIYDKLILQNEEGDDETPEVPIEEDDDYGDVSDDDVSDDDKEK